MRSVTAIYNVWLRNASQVIQLACEHVGLRVENQNRIECSCSDAKYAGEGNS